MDKHILWLLALKMEYFYLEVAKVHTFFPKVEVAYRYLCEKKDG